MRTHEPISHRLADPTILTIVGVGVIVTLLGLLAPMLHARAHQHHSYDFVIFYASGLRLFEGKDVYVPLPLDVLGPIPESARTPQNDMHSNLNPPASVLLLSPLSKLPYAYAFWTWTLISLASAAAATWLVAGAFVAGVRRVRWTIGLLALLLAYSPTWIAFYIGQVSFLLLALFAAGWRALRAANEPRAGILLGAALAIKPFVGVLLIFFMAYRRWRLLVWFLGSFLVINVVALTIMGPTALISYFNALKTVGWHGADLNPSIFGFLARLPGGSSGQTLLESHQWLYVLGLAISILLLFSLLLLTFRLPAWPSHQGIDIGYAYSLVLMLLISPLGWTYYFPILLIPVVVIFKASQGLTRGRLLRSITGAAWLVCAIGYFLFIGKLLPDAEDSAFRIPDFYLAALLSITATFWVLGYDVDRHANTVHAGYSHRG